MIAGGGRAHVADLASFTALPNNIPLDEFHLPPASSPQTAQAMQAWAQVSSQMGFDQSDRA